MELEKIDAGTQGRFVRSYQLHYRLENGKEKLYEMVSRTAVAKIEDLSDSTPEGVVMIVLSEDKTKLLLNREFRPAVAKWVYNFPAGLIDAGESAEKAAARELWEETGIRPKRFLATYGRSYGAVGLSNESAIVCVALADDKQPFGGNQDPMEEICPVWVDKAKACEIMQSGDVTARVQLFLAMWGTDIFL